jgi:DedD protein
MEKEKKKLLLVAISVGFFLLVTITAAIIILTPKANDMASSASISHSSGRAQKNQWDDDVSGNSITQPAIINSKETKETDSNIIEIDRKDIDGVRTIDYSDLSTTASTVTVQPGDLQKRTERPAPVVKAPESVTPATVVKPSAQTNAPKTSVAAKSAPAARTAAPARTINDFWVQTGAFSAQIRAEDAREILASKGITSIIENREINGKIWYRVRLGPYTSEREANHWLGIVKLIDGFGNSQIRQTVRSN